MNPHERIWLLTECASRTGMFPNARTVDLLTQLETEGLVYRVEGQFVIFWGITDKGRVELARLRETIPSSAR